MDLFPLLTPKFQQLHTPEELLFFFFFWVLVNKSIMLLTWPYRVPYGLDVLASLGILKGHCKRSMKMVSLRFLFYLKFSSPPTRGMQHKKRVLQSRADVSQLTDSFLGAIIHSSHCQFPCKTGKGHAKC